VPKLMLVVALYGSIPMLLAAPIGVHLVEGAA